VVVEDASASRLIWTLLYVHNCPSARSLQVHAHVKWWINDGSSKELHNTKANTMGRFIRLCRRQEPLTESNKLPALHAVSPHAERSPTRNCDLHRRIDYCTTPWPPPPHGSSSGRISFRLVMVIRSPLSGYLRWNTVLCIDA
jgi:hypothetical protein